MFHTCQLTNYFHCVRRGRGLSWVGSGAKRHSASHQALPPLQHNKKQSAIKAVADVLGCFHIFYGHRLLTASENELKIHSLHRFPARFPSHCVILAPHCVTMWREPKSCDTWWHRVSWQVCWWFPVERRKQRKYFQLHLVSFSTKYGHNLGRAGRVCSVQKTKKIKNKINT